MKNLEERAKIFYQLIDWISENKEDWKILCGLQGEIDYSEFRRLHTLLYQNHIEQMIPVLFTIHNYAIDKNFFESSTHISNVLSDMCSEKIVSLQDYKKIKTILKKWKN